MQNHASSDQQYVEVIRASAGSGKTHRLTGEYLRLLFAAPDNHRHILAVTFTNKAADEMKSRIIEELFRLSSGNKSSYLKDLMDDFSINETTVRARAKETLETILHDYSAFSVSTIDRFFQQTMRSFARETGLPGGYNIDLDETALLTETIDLMLSELDKPENKLLTDWLLQFMQQNIEEGKSWKINQQILDLSGQLFNETYKSFSDEEFKAIQNKDQLEKYKDVLIRIVKNYEHEVKETATKALDIMRRHGLSYDDFKHKRNSGFLLFSKLAAGKVERPSSRLVALADNVELWHNGGEKESAIRSAFTDGLNDCVNKIIRLSEEDTEYQTAKHLLRNFYTLGILNDIGQRLRLLQQEKNVMLISDTTELLNHIIAESDAPFIYEKTGTRIHHYMIDEFQDTSRMQWENFRPLIAESLASGYRNLIVGDTKQSIYRFRNSDWRLLEKQIKKDFRSDNIREKVLDTNWRSDRCIIDFNNTFFIKAANDLQQELNAASGNDVSDLNEGRNGIGNNREIINAYSDLFQQVPPDKEGSVGQVKVTFLKTNSDTDWKAEVLSRLPAEIEALQDQGIALKDISIIVRWNREAVQVAEALLAYRQQHPSSRYRYDIISNEALLIGSAQSIKAILALMRHFHHPKDNALRMMAIYEFYRLLRSASPDEAIQLYGKTPENDYPEEIKDYLSELKSLPFYEMAEQFFSLLSGKIETGESAYIQAFMDILLQFKDDTSTDLSDFLDWWDETGHNKTLFSPEDQDAIRLITIHKSKGLGFGAAIMPFVNWNLDHNPGHNDIIWCKPETPPFNTLDVAPLKYGKGLESTIFQKNYWDEKRYTYIDNLNLLYVAFTRPKHRLIVYAPVPQKTGTLSSVADLLWKCVAEPDNSLSDFSAENNRSKKKYISLNEYLEEENESEFVFKYGATEAKESVKNFVKQDQNISRDKTCGLRSIPFGDRLKLRFNSIGYFNDDGSRDYGKMMHNIVSHVNTLEDIPNAVKQKISEGELDEDKGNKIITYLTEVLSRPELAKWYLGKYQVLNETQLLHPILGFSRPDRVMIGQDEVIVVDYKFGEMEESKYIRQVQRYVNSIREMGYKSVSGYIVYMKTGKIIKME